MISEKIKAVFKFVDFLHTNTNTFKAYIPMVNECLSISNDIDRLRPEKSFKEKKKYEELNKLKNQKFDAVKINVTDVINRNALELDICRQTINGLEFNWGRSEINKLKEEANAKDVETIIKHKNRYLEFRNEANSSFLSFQIFFKKLDRYLKEIFVFFDENAISEFEAFEAKIVKYGSIEELVEAQARQIWGLKDYFNHYQQTKRIHFLPVLRVFDANEFQNTCEKIDQYKERYTYIYDRLDELGRIEIENDALDNLKKVLDYQTISKFKVVLKKAMDFISNYSNAKTTQPQKKVIRKPEPNDISDLDSSTPELNIDKTNIFDYDYDGLFAISEVKRKFLIDGTVTVKSGVERQSNKFDLKNENVYDKNSGELISLAKQYEYNSNFLIKLCHSYVLDIHPFLNHQYQGTYDKTKFRQFVRYGVLHSPVIKSPGIKEAINDWLIEMEGKKNTSISPQQINKQNPELPNKQITFKNPETIEELYSELKGYFPNKEPELLKALKGEKLNEYLLFPHNQNKFVEVFKRLKYNGYLLSAPKEIKNWICSNFKYKYQKGTKKELRNFSTSSVHDILTKDKGEPTKKERICETDWLPFKGYLTRQKEAQKENL